MKQALPKEQQDVYNLIEKHYRANRRKSVANSYRFAGSWAEDAAQEGYANALQYWNTYDPEKESFDDWIEWIIHNASKRLGNWARGRTPGGKQEIEWYDQDSVAAIVAN